MAVETIWIDGKPHSYLTGADAERATERARRIARLIRERGMTYNAAEIVVNKAMGFDVILQELSDRLHTSR